MAAFELREPYGTGPELDLPVGPWRCAPVMAAYDAQADAGPREPVWRVELAHADAAGRAVLAAGARSVAETHAGLDELPRRLDAALTEAAAEIAGRLPGAAEIPAWSRDASRQARGHEVVLAAARSGVPEPRGPAEKRAWSRDASRRTRGPEPVRIETRSQTTERLRAAGMTAWSRDADRSTSSPEAALIAALTGAAELPGASEMTAWSPGASEPEPGWISRAIDRIAELARGRARIETHLEGALVAHSRMALDGDTELWIGPRLSRAGAAIHARAVAVAVRTRHAWARILTMLMRGSSRLLVLGLPAGVAALPAIWQFVRDVLREVRRRAAAPA